MNSNENVVPETLNPWINEESISASPHGYSESKYICEHLVHEAAKLLDIPCSIARVGQIAGDRLGYWNEKEWFPSIVKSALHQRCLPSLDVVSLLRPRRPRKGRINLL